MVMVMAFMALPLVFVGGRGAGLETGGVFDGPRGRCNIISIGWNLGNTSWGLRGRVGGSRYHIGTPSVKSCKLRVAKIGLFVISNGRKRKRIMLSGNEPHYFPGN